VRKSHIHGSNSIGACAMTVEASFTLVSVIHSQHAFNQSRQFEAEVPFLVYAAVTPACQTGNLVAVYVTGDSSWSQFYTYTSP